MPFALDCYYVFSYQYIDWNWTDFKILPKNHPNQNLNQKRNYQINPIYFFVQKIWIENDTTLANKM